MIMRKIMLATIIVCNVASIANAATKMTIRRDADKSVTVYTRTFVPTVADIHTRSMPRDLVAPPNACDTPTSSAFEIVSRDIVRCVGEVRR